MFNQLSLINFSFIGPKLITNNQGYNIIKFDQLIVLLIKWFVNCGQSYFFVDHNNLTIVNVHPITTTQLN